MTTDTWLIIAVVLLTVNAIGMWLLLVIPAMRTHRRWEQLDKDWADAWLTNAGKDADA